MGEILPFHEIADYFGKLGLFQDVKFAHLAQVILQKLIYWEVSRGA
jgi:hypothetical protein